jgi:hypothetical protein
MTMSLEDSLRYDISRLGLPTDFDIDLRDYSKTYNGRYDPNRELVILYTKNRLRMKISYHKLLKACVHEAIHHYQWKHDEKFVRIKGTMHNQEFKALEKKYLNRLNWRCEEESLFAV